MDDPMNKELIFVKINWWFVVNMVLKIQIKIVFKPSMGMYFRLKLRFNIVSICSYNI